MQRVKGNGAQTNGPISTLLCNTTNQPCNLGQHSATKTLHRRESPAMQTSIPRPSEKRLDTSEAPSQRGKGVRGEKGWKKKNVTFYNYSYGCTWYQYIMFRPTINSLRPGVSNLFVKCAKKWKKCHNLQIKLSPFKKDLVLKLEKKLQCISLCK